MSNEKQILARLDNVSKSYAGVGNQKVETLTGINLTVREGEFIALLGQSGSGKSTILRIMSGLVPASTGYVFSNEELLEGVNPNISIVFQSFALFPWLTVAENVRMGLTKRKLEPEEQDKEIEKALDLVGLGGHDNAYPKELSGGMRQRVGFARALVAHPDILAMDEPFSALDILTAKNLRSEIVNIWRQQNNIFKTAFMVTHSIAEAVSMASRILIISSNPGRIAYEIENTLPYPRNEKSLQFRQMVDKIHDLITEVNMPDAPKEEMRKRVVSGEKERIELLPHVEAHRVIGLLEILDSDKGTTDIFELSAQMKVEFAETIAIAKAAEILGFVETPEHDVLLTSLGTKVVHADPEERTKIFGAQIKRLQLFKVLFQEMSREDHFSKDQMAEIIAKQAPFENSSKIVATMLDWGRFADILDYDTAHDHFVLEIIH
ncbi:MAG TPA: nitrate/sulfonate/bicarbonate ABC transporter ATP-binding protein [Bdellovibrio sp.]|uniref:ABC transporter ATP-binding protein n=1 Tax=Bdellovibrio sp. TaxID=28201 RepID=UPI002F004FAD